MAFAFMVNRYDIMDSIAFENGFDWDENEKYYYNSKTGDFIQFIYSDQSTLFNIFFLQKTSFDLFKSEIEKLGFKYTKTQDDESITEFFSSNTGLWTFIESKSGKLYIISLKSGKITYDAKNLISNKRVKLKWIN